MKASSLSLKLREKRLQNLRRRNKLAVELRESVRLVILVGNAFSFTETNAPEDIPDRWNGRGRASVDCSETLKLQINRPVGRSE